MRWRDFFRRPRQEDTRLFDPDRTIQIGGPIDEGLLVRVTQRILELKTNIEKPIHLLVDSPGGPVERFQQLLDLLFCEDREGRRSPVHAIATGPAASSAAGLVAVCDFAAAFPSAALWFHGVRTRDDVLTEEASLEHGTRLYATNLLNCHRQTTHMFRRMLDTYGRVKPRLGELGHLRGRFAEVLGDSWSRDVIDIAPFAAAVWSQLPGGLDLLVDKAAQSMSLVKSLRQECSGGKGILSPYIEEAVEALADENREEARHRFRVLIALLAARLRSEPECPLDFNALAEVAPDFDYFVESTAPEFGETLLFSTVAHLSMFLDASECEELGKLVEQEGELPPAQSDRFKELTNKAHGRAAPLWAFSLAISRQLQHDEFPIDPESAWWLGLIDHIVGTDFDRRLPITESPSLKTE